MVSSQQRSAGTVVKVVCSPGYVFTDGATETATMCHPDGVWRPLLDNCSGKAFLIFYFLLWGKYYIFIGFSGRLSYNPRPFFQSIDTLIGSYRIKDLGLRLYCNKLIRTSTFPQCFALFFNRPIQNSLLIIHIQLHKTPSLSNGICSHATQTV